MALTPLNSKQRSKIIKQLTEQYGLTKKPFDDKILFERTDKKLFIVSRDFTKVVEQVGRIDSLGLYIAKQEQQGLRLSMEGSQLLGPMSSKQCVTITEKQRKEWFQGLNLTMKEKGKGFVIVKCEDDYIGCGYQRDNELLNYTPKNRRVMDLF
ncbi:hypothetical protein CL622_07305 [archaeon]|nr:hypothetical protein [archaeon]|tara:strand:- start:2473 stop:2931 length:459 start_codon:yes stop_codon:yes gene_type:complete